MDRGIRLPIGETDFREIRNGGYYYVDKTGAIGTLIQDGAKSILFTRPRRFGKTTFQSMLSAFFDIREDSRDIFKELSIMAAESCQRSIKAIRLSAFLKATKKGGSSMISAAAAAR